MTPYLVALLAIWSLGGLLLLLFRGGQRSRGAIVHLVLGALVTLDIWGPPALANHSLQLPVGSLGALELTFSARVLAPCVFLTVSAVYLARGVTATASLLFSLLATLSVVGVGLPLLAAFNEWLRAGIGLAPGLGLSGGAVRLQVAESLSIMIGAYMVVVLLQFLRNRLDDEMRTHAVVLSLLGAGWTQGVLSALGGYAGTTNWAGAVRSEVIGWAFAALALWPVAYLLLRRLTADAPRAELGVPIRPVAEVVQSTLDLRQALHESETRAANLDERLRLLTALRRRIVRAENQAVLLAQVADEIRRSPRFQGCWIGLVNSQAERLTTARAVGLGQLELPRANELDDVDVPSPEQLPDAARVLEWYRSQPELAPLQGGVTQDGRGAIEAAPMRTGSGALGVLAVAAREPDGLDSDDRRWIHGLASDLGHGLSRLWLHQQRNREVRELEAIRSLTTELIAERGVDAVQAMIVEGALELLDADHGQLHVIEGERSRLRLVASRGQPELEIESIELSADSEPAAAVKQATARRGTSQDGGAILAVPLGWRGRVKGVLSLCRRGNRRFSGSEADLLESFANQAGIALENAHLLSAERRRSAELETLRQANLSLTSSLELQAVLEAILQQALKIVSAFDAHIFLYDGKELSFGAALWADDRHREPYAHPRAGGLTSRVARSGERIVIEDVAEHPLYADVDWDWQGAIIGLPLSVGERVLGVMNVAFERPRTFSEDDLHILELLADQASLVLENARLYDRTAAERRRLRLLYDVTREVSSSLDPDEIMQRAAELITRNLGGLIGGVNVIDHESGKITLVGLYGMDPERIDEINRAADMRVGKGFIGWVAEQGKPAFARNVDSDPRWLPVAGVDDDVRSAMAAPVLASGQVVGVLAMFHPRTDAFDEEHLELLTAVCQQVGLAWSNARRYRQVERRLAERTVLQQVAQMINSRLEMEPLLAEIVDQVRNVLGYPVVDVVLVEGEELVLRASDGLDRPEELRFSIERGVTGRVVRTGEAAFVPDVSDDPDYIDYVPEVSSEIAVPLRKGDVVIGALNVEAFEPGALTEEDLRLLMLLGDQISVAVENAALYDRLRRHSQELEAVVHERTAALEQALAQAREADRLKTQFVSDVSHELRTPLSNIRLYVELLSVAGTERFEEYLGTLGRETDRLVALIEDLLSISRLDADSVPMKFKALDLDQLTQALVEDRARLFADRELTLELERAENAAYVRADEQLLAQVLANLMTNAMHYTPRGGRITVGCERDGHDEWVKLYVQDNGLGISEEERERLFTRFFRGEASRKMGNPGTGLGLAICKEIVDRHGGTIEVDSEQGRGSRFTLWLPAADPAEEPARDEVSPERSPG